MTKDNVRTRNMMMKVRRRVRIAAMLVFGCLWSPAALAQVNVEALRGDADREGLSGRAELSVTGQTGNTEGIVAGGSGRIQLREGRHLSFLYATGNYARLNQTTSIAKAMAHLRYDYQLTPWFWSEIFAQLEHDTFRRLTSRELLGTGPRFQLFHSKEIAVFYGTSYMAEWEHLDLIAGDTESASTLSHRWSNYLTVSMSLGDRLSAGTTTYFQPRFDRFSDYRLLNETYLEAGITEVISTKISTWTRYDSAPPDDVESADFMITNAFVAKF